MEMPGMSQLQVGNTIVMTVTSALLRDVHIQYHIGWGTYSQNLLAVIWTSDIFSVLCKVL